MIQDSWKIVGAGKWKTEQGGEYFAAGVGGAITGRGADLLIIDDPHKEQDIKKIVSLLRKPGTGTRQVHVNVCSQVVKRLCNDKVVYKRFDWTTTQGSGRG